MDKIFKNFYAKKWFEKIFVIKIFILVCNFCFFNLDILIYNTYIKIFDILHYNPLAEADSCKFHTARKFFSNALFDLLETTLLYGTSEISLSKRKLWRSARFEIEETNLMFCKLKCCFSLYPSTCPETSLALKFRHSWTLPGSNELNYFYQTLNFNSLQNWTSCTFNFLTIWVLLSADETFDYFLKVGFFNCDGHR